jgi:HK97 family phage portal protein
MSILDIFKTRPTVETLGLSSGGFELKKAFDAARYGQAGVPAYPDTDRASLIGWQRRNEVVYSCIRKKCEAAADPELIVEKRNGKGEWETIDGHPLLQLLERPNPVDSWDDFLTAWIGSEETTGDFYAEIVRDRSGVPIALYPLDPSCMFAVPDAKGGIGHYEFRSGYSPIIELSVTDVLHRRKPDLMSRYYGLSPLKVAIGSVDADQAQTDFTRAFFHSDGVPAGILKINNRSLSQEEANRHQQHWMAKYRRGGSQHKQVAVLDQNAEFQTIGTNLKDSESEITRGQAESRICMVFGVPPALIGAYVGLKLATNNATMKTHMQDFWLNTMSPDMKKRRVWLTINLLSEFESMDLILQKKVRVNWDMTQVMAMQEDEDKRHTRARENFKAGGWTINEFREATGLEPIDGEDYFLQSKNIDAITEEIRQLLAAQEPQKVPAQLPPGQDPNETPLPKQIGDGKNLKPQLCPSCGVKAYYREQDYCANERTSMAELAKQDGFVFEHGDPYQMHLDAMSLAPIKKALTEMVVVAMADEKGEGERLDELKEFRQAFTLPLIEGELLDTKITASVVDVAGAEIETEMTVRQRQVQLQKKSEILMGMLERLYVDEAENN